MSGFDLPRIKAEAAAAPLLLAWPFDVAVAAINDAFRLGGVARPPRALVWLDWATTTPVVAEQAGTLAHLLAHTSLREATVEALTGRHDLDAPRVLRSFFAAVAPLTGEILRTNAFRQEEFLRRWAEAVGGVVSGETPAQSLRRLEQLDYRKTLAEYQRADVARKKEADRRAKLLKEAAEKAAAASGARE